MPRRRKASGAASNRQPLPFLCSPLAASPKNPFSPPRPSSSPPQARSVPVDALSETEYLILPCSQFTASASVAGSVTRSKRRSPRFLLKESHSRPTTRSRSGQSTSPKNGGSRSKRRSKGRSNKRPVVTLIGNEGERRKSPEANERLQRAKRRRDGDRSTSGPPSDTGRLSPRGSGDRIERQTEKRQNNSMIRENSKVSTWGQGDQSRPADEDKENWDNRGRDHRDRLKPNRNEDEEPLLDARRLVTTPRNKRRRTSLSKSPPYTPPPASPLHPLANTINTPILPDTLPDTIPNTYPELLSLPVHARLGLDESQPSTPRCSRIGVILAPETPVAEMGLSHTEKAALARRRYRDSQKIP